MRKFFAALCLTPLLLLLQLAGGARAQKGRPALSQEAREFVSVDAPAVALTRVRPSARTRPGPRP